jgi:mannose-6-phosphate isomerase-like protein (cupin superfamily)
MFRVNIESKTLKNKHYRNVLYTNKDSQLVVMSLLPYEEIGNERHDGSQFIRVESGNGYSIVSGKKTKLYDGIALVINANTYHNIIAGKDGLKLYNVYSPPQHPKVCKELYKEDE